MRHMRHFIGYIALIALALQSTAASALDTGATKCRNYISSKTYKLAVNTVAYEVKCHRLRMLGTVAAAVNCDDIDSAGFPTASVTALNAAAARFLTSVSGRCSGLTPASLGYSACPSPCDSVVPTIGVMEDAASCVVCLAKHFGSAAISTAYGSTPPITTTETTAWTCQNTYAGRGMYTYASARMRQQRACQYKEDRGNIGSTDCKVADLTGYIAKAAASLNTKIGKCLDTDLASLTSCGAAVAAEQACVGTAANTMADILFDFIYPTIPPTPTPTFASTPTSTPTRTPTRTPTSTPTPTSNVLYPVVDTNQSVCYNNLIGTSCPSAGQSL